MSFADYFSTIVRAGRRNVPTYQEARADFRHALRNQLIGTGV